MRKTDALRHRESAAKIAHDRQHPLHVANGEERAYRDAKSFMSFTKGLPHDPATGLVRDKLDPERLRTAIDSGYARDFDLTVPLGDRDTNGELQWAFFDSSNADAPVKLDDIEDGKQHRRWEAPTAGWVYDLEGPDCQAVTMPPAPPIVVQTSTSPQAYKPYESVNGHSVEANSELVAEMAEVYWWACLRDAPFGAFDGVSRATGDPGVDKVEAAARYLTDLPFYDEAGPHHPRRRFVHDHAALDRQNVMRGHTSGDRKGPYLSQFLLLGNRHLGRVDPDAMPPIDNKPHTPDEGFLQYGSIRIDMRVRQAARGHDYMTHWNEWLDVQNGANVRDTQEYVDKNDPNAFRFITTPRDLATYVHFDALYEAYLNACLWLLNVGAPVDPNFAHLLGRTRHTEGFALFGGPQILSLMTEVATRGLKAVRFQKFNNHLRLRPEALAGLVAAHSGSALPAGPAAEHLALFQGALDQSYGGINILDEIGTINQAQNARHTAYLGPLSGTHAGTDNLPLLPMAFPEGSPMHPSYGAGHATVAGACVTILKAFFDEDACLVRKGVEAKAVPASEVVSGGYQPFALVPNDNGDLLEDKGTAFGQVLRVGDELNKLAANISIGRNMAGVHYYSDYIDSLRMGEEIAIGILQEQSIMYPKDAFHLSLTSFDGHKVVIGEGEVQVVPDTKHHDKGYRDAYVASAPYQKPEAA
ncbi:MAG: vanadium-dependent haloperoxidase [Geminicoccaceae bacterium]